MTRSITFDQSDYQYMMDAYKKFNLKYPTNEMKFTKFIFVYFKKIWESENGK
jgi:hypothetical protein